ncbi:hypothetical protein [Gryllotalpicola ginsengisoli]|uniref:hypothetical protein n=1 Tax=Gryllotalpicola ginsengisoli TaxID=444608 RepID=UPI0003B40B14|nr:hypothetical protein [Gryllotalpicola ginsengisoli]
MTASRRAALAALAASALALAGCAQQPQPRLADLTAHVQSQTILPVTVGHGDRHLSQVKIAAGEHIGIEASCSGKGSVTVSVPSGHKLIADCSTSSGSQKATVEYQNPAAATGAIAVTTSSPKIEWNTTVYDLGQE